MPVSLMNMHRNVMAGAAAGSRSRQNAWVIPAPDFIDDADGLFRILEVPDRAAAIRRAWLDDVIDCEQQYNHSRDPAGYLSQAQNSFSVLLISGDDMPRIYAIMREVLEVLPGKVVVPVLRHCSTGAMVALLRRGAADVLHSRMPPGEGVARLHALARRMEWAERRRSSAREADARADDRLRSIAGRRLTPMEERLLAVLVEREGQVVSYSCIASRISTYWEEQGSRRSIRVAVCYLRRKLRAGFQIENSSGRGYVLSCKPARTAHAEAGHA